MITWLTVKKCSFLRSIYFHFSLLSCRVTVDAILVEQHCQCHIKLTWTSEWWAEHEQQRYTWMFHSFLLTHLLSSFSAVFTAEYFIGREEVASVCSEKRKKKQFIVESLRHKDISRLKKCEWIACTRIARHENDKTARSNILRKRGNPFRQTLFKRERMKKFELTFYFVYFGKMNESRRYLTQMEDEL